MNIAIHKMSYYIEEFLKCARTGTIHSVYRKTINLSVDGKIIAIQAKESPLSPISLITELSADEIEKLSIKRNTPVTLSAGCIELSCPIGPCHFSYIHAEKIDLLLSGSICSDARKILIENLDISLFYAGNDGFNAILNHQSDDSLSLMLLAAKNRIENSSNLYKNGSFLESGKELSKLLGLGIGLTPSGDDFLCGVLAGLRLLGQENSDFAKALKSEIQEHLSDTIDISAAFLSCALDNQYSLAVNSLYLIPSFEEILKEFSEIGHSSGIDTLCGILYILKLNI